MKMMGFKSVSGDSKEIIKIRWGVQTKNTDQDSVFLKTSSSSILFPILPLKDPC